MNAIADAARPTDLARLFAALDPLQPQAPPEPERAAAVLIAISAPPAAAEIIFTRRAAHLSSHAGQVSFPGGRWETQDGALHQTALREAHEELSLPPQQVALKGQLASRISAKGLRVTPFVGQVPAGLKLTPCVTETAAVFRVPLRFFTQVRPVRVDCIQRADGRARVAAWDYQGFEIWGLTAHFTEQLLARMGLNIDYRNLPERTLG
ncbi:MAG: CoA pyrophosphatase [Cellvibrionales bacterium]|nr:CoA pyrophosphatase [Cellvibrionales bacterium]